MNFVDEIIQKSMPEAMSRHNKELVLDHIFVYCLKNNNIAKKYKINFDRLYMGLEKTNFKLGLKNKGIKDKVTGEISYEMPTIDDDVFVVLTEIETIEELLDYCLEYESHMKVSLIINIGQKEFNSLIEELSTANVHYEKVIKEKFPFIVDLSNTTYQCNPAISREKILMDIQKTLLKLNKPNVLMVGEPGVGKTAIAEGIAYLIQNNLCLPQLNGYRVLSVSTGNLISGTRYRGEFEERVNELCNFIKDKHIILFIDEMHTAVNAGGSEGSVNLSNILKPYLARGEFKVIGATTVDEFKRDMTDKAYNRRFSIIEVPELSNNATLKVLEKSLTKFENHYNAKVDEKWLSMIVNESAALPGKMPDKTIDLLEEIMARLMIEECKITRHFIAETAQELQSKFYQAE